MYVTLTNVVRDAGAAAAAQLFFDHGSHGAINFLIADRQHIFQSDEILFPYGECITFMKVHA